ncbi:hypothetical protein K6V90_09490 [Cupriavidus pauculus]|uniref:hypothetical protein n=1 Tax=Cupriavidus pauculus TaxID=82633 RepID=UPI001C933216|nr:hypothetical protein [Cupriavidus pauculus]MBY4730764.1 hypothetical protein [Cupriavidus pauculus]
MKRPSFQFYPADWRNNAKLRRCSEAARGAWMDILCVLHDSDEYGICRWPLADLARAAGVPMKLAKELAAKDVLKGADKDSPPYVYTPRHAGKNGEPVTLVESSDAPCWYCSRLVRDEWVRQRRGSSSQFTADNQPPKKEPKDSPKGGIGERQGYGPTSSSSSSTTTNLSIPDGMDADASLIAPEGIDAKDAIWQIAVPWLIDRKVPDKSARSLLGAAIKVLREDGAWSLCQRMMQERPMEPAAWLSAALNAQTKISAVAAKGNGLNRQEALEQRNRQIAAQLSEEFHKGVPQ